MLSQRPEGLWIVLEIRVPFGVPFYKGAVLFGDQERDPNLENYSP